MTEDKWAVDHRSPSDWGNIARLAELDNSDTQLHTQDVQWEEPLNFSTFAPPDEGPPLREGQFDRFGR